jgi:signal transduction histidine kinase
LHFFIGRDVTAAKLMERLKNEFVATMSHELRTPLTSIAGALGLLAYNAEAMPAPTQRLLTIAKANCQRLLRLVSGVLDLDQAESGEVVFVLKRIVIRALVEQAIESNRGAAEGVGVRIGLNLISDAGEMRGDPDWLLKAVNNLLSNAIAFSLPGGEVVVGIEKRGRNIRVSVRGPWPRHSRRIQGPRVRKVCPSRQLGRAHQGGRRSRAECRQADRHTAWRRSRIRQCARWRGDFPF